MFDWLKSLFRPKELSVRQLAAKALETAAELYASGKFEWITGYELKDGEHYDFTRRPMMDKSFVSKYKEETGEYNTSHIDAHKVYEVATGGCLLGGVAKAAWLVCGKPMFGTEGWTLKNEVEKLADELLIRKLYPIVRGYEPPESAIASDVRRGFHQGGGIIPGFNDGQLERAGGASKAAEVLREAARIR